ncbi:MAG: hypothetical protein ACI86H_002241 [bacterium]
MSSEKENFQSWFDACSSSDTTLLQSYISNMSCIVRTAIAAEGDSVYVKCRRLYLKTAEFFYDVATSDIPF